MKQDTKDTNKRFVDAYGKFKEDAKKDNSEDLKSK
jgi:hypothetical protein